MSGRGNQHRQQAFEELFRRPAPSSSSSSSRPNHQVQQPYGQQQAPSYSYPGASAYPDYPPTATQNAASSYNQFGMINGGGGGPSNHSHLQGYNPPPQNQRGTYRTTSAGSSYYEQPSTSNASAYSNQYPSTHYDSHQQQQYAAQLHAQQQRAYQQQQYPQGYHSNSSGGGGGGTSSEDYHSAPVDPAAPIPPPGAAASGGARYSSPRSQYAPTMSSGPPTASTSTSLFSRQSTSSVSSLPYSYPESILNGVEPSNARPRSPPRPSPANVVAPLPSVPGYGPPRLPDIPQGSDDFFSNQPEGMWQGQSASSRGSGGAGPAGAVGGLTPTPYSTASYGRKGSSPSVTGGYVGDEADSIYGYDNPYSNSSAFDRSRRSSVDSDRRSLYQQPPTPHQTLIPANPSVNSLPYPYGNGNAFATSNPALQSRRSSESMRVLSNQPRPLTSSISSLGHDSRALSFSSIERPDMKRAMESASTISAYPPARPPSHGSTGATSMTGQTAPGNGGAPRRSPVVYPALLSRVAEAFKERIICSERIKDGLVYSDAFDGRDAVDKIAYIIKTSDRNLALLLGRALDAQKFFHDVTYDHRLRDSPVEIYRFKERLSGPFLSSDDLAMPEEHQQLAQHPHAPGSAAARAQAVGEAQYQGGGGHARTPSYGYSSNPYQQSQAPQARPTSAAETLGSADDSPLPSGVFTLLTDCYSPTCTRDRLCYSIACPRRLEQQARLNLKREGLSGGLEEVSGGLKRSDSVVSLGDLREPGTLWIHSVPQDVLDSTSDSEKKRQEAINEVFYTERDFVRDLEYLRDSWIKPLRSQNIIPEARREDFVTQVFWNVLEIYAVNVRLADLLNKRQKQSHVVDHVGDIFLDMVPHFAPFVKYGAHQLYGKYEFEKEKGSNPAFAKFVEETERLPESRKLELNAYLTKPTTRLARYPLLLEACLKNTPDDNPDKLALPKVIKLVREFLGKVNVESGKSENRFNLAQLDQQLVFKNGEAVDLRLRDEERELIYKGPLKKRGGTQSESAELQVFLFDHAILMVKQKSKNEQYKVYRKPIPLELLVVAAIDDAATARSGVVRPKSLMARGSSNKSTSSATAKDPPPGVDKNSKQGFAITFIHLGRRGYQITLWASTWTARKKWLEKIEERQNDLRERSLVFETVPLSAGYFVGTNRLTCAAPFDNGNRMVYGTENGVYLADLRDKTKVPVKVISVPSVTQLDVLEEQGILIVLADKAVQTFFVDHLDPGDAVGAAKRARKISAHATFFKAGQCLGRTLVCVVKSGNVSSTIKTLEPIDQVRGKKQPAIRKFLQGSNESLRVFKEFYIPTESSSVHFLKSKLCVGCTKGFEIVDLETLDTQGLLDPADSSLDFVQKRENAKPVAIYRIDGEFLLCYDEFAFYVNKNGWRAKSNWIIQWEGFPTSFALHYPYVLAFEPTFIEVRHVESGALMQIIPGNNIRCLFADSPPSASSSSASPYYANNSRYGSPYGQQHSRFPSPTIRNDIIVCDGDRAFSLFSPSV
ncbi:uncharacterized protein JCM6883_002593 [Sporobolomyces salmoneus]|uniref:uncharacterized protein n=1 Tax=Sporobolomyces salmoneus TaxID=183962 RepID=UPI003175418B